MMFDVAVWVWTGDAVWAVPHEVCSGEASIAYAHGHGGLSSLCGGYAEISGAPSEGVALSTIGAGLSRSWGRIGRISSGVQIGASSPISHASSSRVGVSGVVVIFHLFQMSILGGVETVLMVHVRLGLSTVPF